MGYKWASKAKGGVVLGGLWGCGVLVFPPFANPNGTRWKDASTVDQRQRGKRMPLARKVRRLR